MLASAELWGDDGKAVLCSQFSENSYRSSEQCLRKSPIAGKVFENQLPVASSQSPVLNKGCGYPWSDGACSGVQAIPALTAIFASIYKGLRWFSVLGALLSNNPLRRQSTAARSSDFAQDFACGFPLRSRPQSGSSSQWPASSWLSVPSSKRSAWNFFRECLSTVWALEVFSGSFGPKTGPQDDRLERQLPATSCQ